MSSVLKLLVDSNCEVYCDFELKGEASPESLFRLSLMKGVYILQFKRDNETLSTINYTMQTNDEEDLLKVDLIEIINNNEREDNYNQIQSKNVKIEYKVSDNEIDKFYIIDQETFDSVEIPYLVSARNLYDDYFSQLAPTFDECGLITISNGGEIEHYHSFEYYWIHNGKFGCINKNGDVQIKPIYDNEIYFLNQHVTVGHIGDKYYFINKWGEEAFENCYDKVSNFIIDKCIVYKNNKCGVINCFGKLSIPIIYDYLCVDINAIRVRQGDKWGLLDFDGNSILPIIYDSIVFYSRYFSNCWFDCESINQIERQNRNYKDLSKNEQIYRVELKGRIGLITNTGNINTPVECIGIPIKSLDLVLYNGKYQVLGHNQPFFDAIYTKWGEEFGNCKRKLDVSDIYFVNYEDSILNCYRYNSTEELLANKFAIRFKCNSFANTIMVLNGKKGIIGVTECIYDEIEKKDFFYYKVLMDGFYGLLDRHGEEIIPCKCRLIKNDCFDVMKQCLTFTFDNINAVYNCKTKKLEMSIF